MKKEAMPPMKRVMDAEFIAAWAELQSPVRVAERLGLALRNVHARRRRLEQNGQYLPAADIRTSHYYKHIEPRKAAARHEMTVENGIVIVFSDAHFWPGVRTTAFRGLLYMINLLKPVAVINNGDAFDGAAISRYPRIGWDSKPKVADELKACEDRLGEIQAVAGDAKLIWPMGNHDSRYETFLAAHAPQYEGVPGFSLKDKFPAWLPCWSCWINDDVVVKHRLGGGTHATHNNTVKAGKTVVTGHLHSGKVTGYTDYNGTRFGVDCGTIAEPRGAQFVDYLEDGPTNWTSSFAVLKFRNGRLLWPQLAVVHDFDHIEFMQEIFDVSKI